MLVFKVNLCTCPYKTGDVNHALSSSAGVDRIITGKVCRKSPDNKMSVRQRAINFLLNLLMYDGVCPILLSYIMS